MKPTLLYVNSEYSVDNASIDENVITDLRLDNLFGRNVLNVIRQDCSREDIVARQRMFTLFENEDYFGRFSSFSSAVTNLSQAFTAYDSAENDVATLLSAYNVCVIFAKLYEAALKLDADSIIIRNLIEYFKEYAHLFDEIQAINRIAHANYEALISFCLTFGDNIEFTEQADEVTYRDRIFESCAALKIDISLLSGMRSNLTPQLSAAIKEKFSREISALSPYIDFAKNISRDMLKLHNEAEFYIAIHQLCATVKSHGLKYSLPKISDKRVYKAVGAFDVSLKKNDDCIIVTNAIDFSEDSPRFILTGANDGGKTTYLRTCASNLLFGIRGCPMFCAEAEIFPFERIFTHFSSDERDTELGRLFEEEKRVSEILAAATSKDFVFLNETYSGADENKGTERAISLVKSLQDKGIYFLFVTHFHGVISDGIGRLNAVVDPTDSSRRTYKIERCDDLKSSGNSFAIDILKKYSLTKAELEKRYGSLE